MQLCIKNLQEKTILVSEKKTILQSLAENYIDWMQACGAKGRCTTCKMTILEGKDELSPLSNAEVKFLRQGRLYADERLACQAKPLASIENKKIIVSVP
ncbi:MAG: 2Fe-2S iron-sulfur cluster-binding protein, partial [Raineya sp.]